MTEAAASTIEQRFFEAIDHYGMVRPGDRVILAVSGGKDSYSMLELFCRYRESHFKDVSFLVSTIDASLVGMSVQTGAESMGLGAVMIGAMRNHPQEVASLLGLPPHVYVTYGMCLGWPVNENIPPQKPRLPRDLIIHEEKYDRSNPKPKIEAYNIELAQHYVSLGKNLDPAAWSGVIARSLSGPMRPENLQRLADLGFNICSVSDV